MKFIAYTTKGLEFVTENEIKSKISDAKILEVADKRVVFESSQNLKQLVSLKTVDDIGLVSLTLDNINNLTSLLKAVEKNNLKDIKDYLTKFREISNSFSITTSLVGIKTFDTPELVDSLSNLIHQKYNWHFTEFIHTNFDIRIFIDHTKGYVSIRLSKKSIQHRPYKIISKAGSLKPTIAAAMILLTTRGHEGIKMVDNFCGSGTILAEGLLLGLEVYGGDIDSQSVLITQENLSNLGYKSENKIKPLNALSSKWPDNYFDCAISNLPWGKQISIKSITYLYEGSIQEYSRILQPKGTLCVLISQPDLFIKYAKKYFPGKKIEQYKIGLLGQNPTIVLLKC